MEDKLMKAALNEVMNQEIDLLEAEMKYQEEHQFSDEFELKMKKMISESNRKAYVKMPMRKMIMVASIAIMVLVGCVGYAPLKEIITDLFTNTFSAKEFGNIAMGLGRATYDEKKVYFTDVSGKLFAFDLNTSELSGIPCSEQLGINAGLYAHGDYIYFLSEGLKRVAKDSSEVELVFGHQDGILQTYVDGNDVYFLEGIEGALYYRNHKNSTEQQLFETVLSFFVDETNIYVIAREEGIPYLFVADIKSKQFEKQSLSFTPISVYVENEDIYLTEQSTYQIVKVSDVEERLPIYSTYFQVKDDIIIYLDGETFEDSCFTLMSYHLDSGEKEMIMENVFVFSLLGDEYIYIQQDTNADSKVYLYDYQEFIRMK